LLAPLKLIGKLKYRNRIIECLYFSFKTLRGL
jgi:hypothetical protein